MAPVAPRVAMPVAQAAPQEVAQLAIDAGFIWGTAGICFAMTLVVWMCVSRENQGVRPAIWVGCVADCRQQAHAQQQQ